MDPNTMPIWGGAHSYLWGAVMDGGGINRGGRVTSIRGVEEAAPDLDPNTTPFRGGDTVCDLWGAVMDGGAVNWGGVTSFGGWAAAPDLDPNAARGGGGDAVGDLWGAVMEGEGGGKVGGGGGQKFG